MLRPYKIFVLFVLLCFENFRGLRKFVRDRNCRIHKIFSRQARQVRKGPANPGRK